MKRFAPLLGILVLIGLLALLNKDMNKNAGRDNDDAPPDPAAASPRPAATKITTTAQDPLPSEITLGNAATAQYKVTVGWVYDRTNQPDPAALAQAIDTVKQGVAASGGRLSAEIVNLDMPPDELSPQAQAVTELGVAINDGPRVSGERDMAPLTGNLGEGAVSAAAIKAALASILNMRASLSGWVTGGSTKASYRC